MNSWGYDIPMPPALTSAVMLLMNMKPCEGKSPDDTKGVQRLVEQVSAQHPIVYYVNNNDTERV